MNKLEFAVHNCRASILKKQLCKGSNTRYCTALNHLLKLGVRENISTPCQELFDIFISESTTKDNLSTRRTIVRWIDKEWDLKIIDFDGCLFNVPDLPNEEEIKKILFPIGSETSFNQLIAYTLSLMKYSHGSSTYGQYVHAFKHLRSWLIINNKNEFNVTALKEYKSLNEDYFINCLIKEWVFKIRRRCVNILLDVAKTGKFEWHLFVKKEYVDKNIEDLIDGYFIKENVYTKNSKNTQALHRYVFLEMIKILGIESEDDLKSLNRKNFEELCDRLNSKFCQNSLTTIYPICRHIITYLYDRKLLDLNYGVVFMNQNYFKEYNPCLISKEDEIRIIEYLNHCSFKVKAIMMLAIRYGLRDSDICELRFDEIDWFKEIININQRKTDNPLVLPLLDDVGNAIIDYIENDRPNVNSPYIFLRNQRPYERIKSAYSICARIFNKLEIKTSNNKGKGIHVFRYTLAKRLLETQIPHQIITDTLGHVSNDSDKYYYSMEEEKLKMCCLDARWIGVKTWK